MKVSLDSVQIGDVSSTEIATYADGPGYTMNVWPPSLPNEITETTGVAPSTATSSSLAVTPPTGGHYMTMWVNTQKNTQYATPVNGEQSSVPTINNILSSAAKTQRSSESFTIFVPDGVQFESSQTYEDYSIGGTYFAAGLAGLGSIQEFIRKSKGGGVAQPRNLASSLITPFAGVAVNQFLTGLAGRGTFTALTGLAFNPFMEVIYSKPNFRTFRFDYLLFPRTPSEAASLRTFIQRLRFHSAPENKGFFLIPPSTFDIEFFFGGATNANIEKIYTCVLERIDVDYTAVGQWSTYVDGMPIGTRLSLSFKEIVYLTKADYESNNDRFNREYSNNPLAFQPV